MFKFDFSKDNPVEINENPQINWFESKEILSNPTIINQILNHNDLEYNTVKLKDLLINYVSPKSVVKILQENKLKSDIVQAENNHSDLITGVYEGGLKIWECTYDLADFICEKELPFTNKNILDLGCGMGIIGILALLKGATVDFQDYNFDVIQYTTMLNLYLTTQQKEDLRGKSKFYSGDWRSFTELLSKEETHVNYDYIFTSETIYNTNNYDKLIELFKTLLKPNGKIYLAAKTYYFGVGGCIRQFEDCLKDNDNFNCSTVWKCNEGICREILEIALK